jgi:hypothetical protein
MQSQDEDPLNISNLVIASACPSPAQDLRFLVRHFRESPSDHSAVELILTLNMRLGQIQRRAASSKQSSQPPDLG